MDQQNNGAGGTGLMNKVKEGAVSQLNTQKDRATSGIGSVANAVRQTMQPLRDSQQETMAHYVEQAAGQLDRFSNALKQKDVNELLSDAQRFARRNPAIFIGSAFAIGLVAARFFKSSSDRDSYRGDWRRDDYGGSGRGYRSGSTYEGGYGTSPVGTSGAGASNYGGSSNYGNPGSGNTSFGTGAGTQGGGASGTGTSGLGTSGTATSRGEWGNDSGRS
jgi:hypothetical protein